MTELQASTLTCGCGTRLSTWDNDLRAWLPPIGEAVRIHDPGCTLTARKATA